MHIPVKSGRLATGAYSPDSPIKGDVFMGNRRTQTSNLPVEGGLVMPRDRSLTVYASPNVGHFSISTQPSRPAKVSYYNVHEFTPATLPEVSPQTRTVLNRKAIVPTVKTVFGGVQGGSANTPFQPKATPVTPPPKFRSERAGERHLGVSFPSVNNLWNNSNNSFYSDQIQVGSGRVGRGRWNVEKASAV